MSQEQLNLEATMTAHSDPTKPTMQVCPVHGEVEHYAYANSHNRGGQCIECDRARVKENDALKARASERLGLGRGIGGGTKWSKLPIEIRNKERDRQREIDEATMSAHSEICPVHGETEFYSEDRKYGGKAGTCKECDRERALHAARSRRAIITRPDGRVSDVSGASGSVHIARKAGWSIEFYEIDGDVASVFAAFETKAIEDKRFTHPELDKIRQEDGFREAAKREQKRLNGFVYLIHDLEHPGILKIGKSSDPVQRLSTLNVGSCYGTLRIHDAVYSARAYDMERAMQAIGDGRWSRTNGEWFKLNDETYDDVLNMLKEVQNDDPNF